MLTGILTALLILTVLVLIILITVFQHGNEGGIGTSLGGGNSAGFFGASGGANVIVKATWVTGGLFFLLSITLAWVRTNESFAVSSEIESLLSEPVTAPGAQMDASPATTEEGTSPVEASGDAAPSADESVQAKAPDEGESTPSEVTPADPSAEGTESAPSSEASEPQSDSP